MMVRGKVALVTGAASGIGKAIAECFAREGAAVVLTDLDAERGEATREAMRAGGGETVFVRCDVSNPADSEKAVNTAIEKFGQLDCACNNAGIGGEQNATADMSIDGWNQVIAINLSGVFYGMKYQIPAILKAGGGAIVNVASILGQVGFAKASAYVAAKHGIVGLSKNAALEYATQNLRVNSIGPAFIHTPLITSLEENPRVYEALVAMHPMGRLGKPEEVAELVVWLCSSKASFVTGAYYAVDGGYLAK